MKLRALNSFFALAFTTSVLAKSVQAESPQLVKGTHVLLAAPAGFAPSDKFPGFEANDSEASLIVGELPTPFSEMSRELTAGGFKTQGMTLLSREAIGYGEFDGLLLATVQTAGKVDYLKWIGAFGDERVTYMVTATFPKREAQLSDALKDAVLTARIDHAPVKADSTAPSEVSMEEALGAVPFRVDPADGMRIAKVVGRSVVLSQDGVFPVKDIRTPVLVAGAAFGNGKELHIEDPRAFAEARLQKIANLKNIKVTGSQKITIDKITGYEFLAQAVEKESGAKAIAYQVILFDDDGYYLMQGIGSAGDAVSQLETFKKISRSFRRN